jgi:inosine-uridine nucleoside N-ribohydrolase
MKVLLDTDIGSDIDDAVCLAYLLCQPDCELMGVTTVSGRAVERAAIARALCRSVGRSIPVYPGVEKPLLGEQRQAEAPQAEALTPEERRQSFQRGEAVEFLRRTIRANPGEIYLLSIGPLTNLGLLFSIDPEVSGMLRGLVSMGGYFTGTDLRAEWNVLCDPHAAHIVLDRAPESTRLVGLDVTLKVTMPAAEVKRRFVPPILRRVQDFAAVWFRKSSTLTFHDPLAAVVLFDPSVCEFQRGDAEVALDDEPGTTSFHARPSGRHEIAVSVNPERFFEHYFSVFG